ncbi:hypothetical protein ES703_108925 [subsurface metagenome]
MKFCFKTTMLLLYPIFLVSLGCSEKEYWSTDPPSDEKITETNKIREKYGIRQIKKNWSFNYREFGAEHWKDERGFPCKSVRYGKNSEQILSEHDFYRTGRTYPSLDPDGGNSFEKLTIAYDYIRGRFAIAPTTDNKNIIHMMDPLREHVIEFGYTGKTNEEALEVADKILKMWGLERL